MSTVYLHIGYPKTGTSSIQVFLRDNAPALQGFGYYVPLIGQGRVGGHHALVRALIGLPVSPRQAVSEAAILSELAAAKDRAVLISSEMLSGLLGDRAQAQTMLGKLRGSHPKVVLIMYVRNQPQFLNSAYSQGVKSFRREDDFRAYLAQVLSHVDQYSYNRWIPLARDLGVELRARPFSKQIREDGIIRDYLRAADLQDTPEFAFPERVNESAIPFTVEAARRLLDGIPDGLAGLTFLQATRCKLALEKAVRDLGIKEAPYCGLDTSSARNLESEFKPNNDLFAREFWRQSWEEVFRDDLGRPFTPNDYRETGVPPETGPRLDELLARVGPEIALILKNRFASVREPWNALPG